MACTSNIDLTTNKGKVYKCGILADILLYTGRSIAENK